ncbi:MAG: hypothetical protein QNJ34_06625 [Xenococcaceae cyanobacterium MO_188.B29]|nr:hypothetical protein [Xenococcaceae cyanobacterium MO_188.B29]
MYQNQNFSNHQAQVAWNKGADAWNHFVESKVDYSNSHFGKKRGFKLRLIGNA